MAPIVIPPTPIRTAVDVYRSEPSCGFSFYDPVDSTDQNKDIYISLYNTRTMSNKSLWSFTAATAKRRLRATEAQVQVEFDATAEARAYSWNESSMHTRCDFIGNVVRGMQELNMTLRPLEIVEYELCIEQRAYGEALSNTLGSIDMPKDLFYNWRTKYLLALDAFMGSYLYINWAIKYNESNPIDIAEVAKSNLMFPETFLSILRLLAYEGAESEGGDILLDEEDVYHANATVAETAQAIRKDAGTAMARIFNEVQKHNLTMEWNDFLGGVDIFTRDILGHPAQVRELASLRSPAPRARRRLSAPAREHRVVLRLRRLSEKTCTEPCTDCEIVDDVVVETLHGLNAFTDYYRGPFEEVLEAFSAALGSPSEAIPIDLPSRNTTTPTAAPVQPAPTWPPLPSNLSFARKTELFFNTVDERPIPMYGHGLSYYLWYPFQHRCDMDKVVYCQTDDEDRRVKLPLAIVASTLVGIVFFFAWANVPYFNVIPILALPVLVASVYLGIVYEYQPLCLPYIPHCLVDDVSVFLDEALESVRCMCQYLPDLTDDCTECEAIVIRMYDTAACESLPHFKNLSIFWAPITAMKVYFPLVLRVVFNFPIVDTIVSALGLVGFHEGAVEALQIDCVNAYILDTATVSCIFAAFGYLVLMWGETLYNIAVPLTRLLWLSMQIGLNSAMLLLNSDFSARVFLSGLIVAILSVIPMLV